MTENEPSITVMCDMCEEDSEPYELTALAGGGWDSRGLKRALERDGWRVEDGGKRHTCDSCIADEKESA